MAAKRPKRPKRRAKSAARPKKNAPVEISSRDWVSDPDPQRRLRSARRALADARDFATRVVLLGAIAQARLDQGDRAGARREWLAMAKAGITPVRAAIEAGLLAEADHKPKLAEHDYRLAAQSATSLAERAESWAALARFYVRSGQAKRALPLLRDRAKKLPHPLLKVAAAYVEARIGRNPAPLAKHRKTMEKLEAEIPLFSYFLGFLDLWDGRAVDAVKSLRRFVSRGVDAGTTWGRELAPELDHARRTILQLEAMARVILP